MREVIKEVVDEGRFVELSEYYAENVLIGLPCLDGHSIGIVGNQPSVLAGCLDIDARGEGKIHQNVTATTSRLNTFC